MFECIALHNSIKFRLKSVRKTSRYSQEAKDAQIEGTLDESRQKDWHQVCEGGICVLA